MSTFTEPLILKFLDTNEAKRFEVVSPFTYYIDRLEGDLKVEVPIYFRTDFASVPRVFWRVIPPVGLYGKAAVVHDYLCEHGTAWQKGDSGNWSFYAVSRKEADQIFRDAMAVLGVGKVKRNVMFWGVKLYSIFTFKK